MSTAAIVILTVILTLAASGVGLLAFNARKKGMEIPWDKIRPILTEVFVEAMKLREADAMGYQKLEDYAVNFVRSKIASVDFLTSEEKGLLSEQLIRNLIRPRLQELYNKKG